MAKGWKCDRCSAQNDEAAYNCSNCGLIRGSVVVPGTYPPVQPNVLFAPATEPEPAAPPSDIPPAAQGVGAPLATDWVTPPPADQRSTRPIWRRIPIRLAIIGVIIVAGAIAGFITNASRSSTGDITKSGDLVSNDLRVGDCWDLKDPSADVVDNVVARPCSQEHEYEVFFIGSPTTTDYPGEAGFTTYVSDNCAPAFDAYVGKAYADSELDIFWLYPNSDGWTSGDRSVECSVYHPRVHRLTGSLKGSAR
jgi:hypothetical protein